MELLSIIVEFDNIEKTVLPFKFKLLSSTSILSTLERIINGLRYRAIGIFSTSEDQSK